MENNFPEMIGGPPVYGSVSKEFIFHAAHKDEEAHDQCGRLHGHTYKICVTAEGEKKGRMILHGDLLKKVYKGVEPFLEHQYLNETLQFNPTMENLCAWILHMFTTELNKEGDFNVKVKLWETPTMFCEIG